MRLTRTAPVRFCTALAAALSVAAGAQSKQAPAAADYGQWETLAAQPRGGLSPDGRWLVYGINRSNRENELRITNVADGTVRRASFGSQPVFSADSKWIATRSGSRGAGRKTAQAEEAGAAEAWHRHPEHGRDQARHDDDDRGRRVVRLQCRRHALGASTVSDRKKGTSRSRARAHARARASRRWIAGARRDAHRAELATGRDTTSATSPSCLAGKGRSSHSPSTPTRRSATACTVRSTTSALRVLDSARRGSRAQLAQGRRRPRRVAWNDRRSE